MLKIMKMIRLKNPFYSQKNLKEQSLMAQNGLKRLPLRYLIEQKNYLLINLNKQVLNK